MTVPDDLDGWEQELRSESGFRAPLEAARTAGPSGPPPRSTAVLRRPAPTDERTPPREIELNAPFKTHPLPAGAVITGPVTSRTEARAQLEEGTGWLVSPPNPDGTVEPVPVVTGQYYDGSPRLAIIAEVMVPPPESQLYEAMDTVNEGGQR